MTAALHGLGVSRGLAIGRAYVLARDELAVTEYKVNAAGVETEIDRFKVSLEAARDHLRQIQYQIPTNTPADIRAFIDTHLLMLDDPALAQVPIDIIRIRRCNAEWAVKLQRDALVNVFEQIEDPYLRGRSDDVSYVVNQILRMLMRERGDAPDLSTDGLKGAIVVADDLSPADTVMLQHQGVSGFVTEFGGTTSHTAILAKSLGIPAVVGIHGARRLIAKDEMLVVDGRYGVVLAAPDETIIKFYQQRRHSEAAHAQSLDTLRGQPSISRDKKKVELFANAELAEEILSIRRVGAEGIGLYRTELLFLNREKPPSEEEQFVAYREVVEALNGLPVTIRTLDVGADKSTPWNPAGTLNPALGLRGIRWCLREPDVFRAQLRAILRASHYGQVRMMLPMVCAVSEVKQTRLLIDEARAELEREGHPLSPHVPLGGMIEVPAAALIAEQLAAHLDFLSIGTNDLIQYTVAADRMDDAVNYLYDPLHPAVLRLISMAIHAGQRAGIPVAMCGEMAGDSRFTRLLLGMGLREFSMHPALLLEIKRLITISDIDDLISRVKPVLTFANTSAVLKLVEDLNREN